MARRKTREIIGRRMGSALGPIGALDMLRGHRARSHFSACIIEQQTHYLNELPACIRQSNPLFHAFDV